jgi:hypothetical protein
MYRASQETGSGDGGDTGGGTASGGSGEEVVDADFEEIPEDERRRSAS